MHFDNLQLSNAAFFYLKKVSDSEFACLERAAGRCAILACQTSTLNMKIKFVDRRAFAGTQLVTKLIEPFALALTRPKQVAWCRPQDPTRL